MHVGLTSWAVTIHLGVRCPFTLDLLSAKRIKKPPFVVRPLTRTALLGFTLHLKLPPSRHSGHDSAKTLLFSNSHSQTVLITSSARSRQPVAEDRTLLQHSREALQLTLQSYLSILLLFYLLSISFFVNFSLKLELTIEKPHDRGLGSKTGSSVVFRNPLNNFSG